MAIFNDLVLGGGMIASHAVTKPLQDAASNYLRDAGPHSFLRERMGEMLYQSESFTVINAAIGIATPLAIHSALHMTLGWATGSSASVAGILARTALSFLLAKADESLNFNFVPKALSGVNSNMVKIQDQTQAILDQQIELGEKICHVTGRTTLKQLLRATNRTQYRVLSVFSGMPAYAHAAVVAVVMCATHLFLGIIALAFLPTGRGFEPAKQNFSEAWTDIRGAGLALSGVLYPLSVDPIVKRFIEREQWKLLPATMR